MRHLIFVDRRIRGRGGHNLEYCLRVAAALEPAGFRSTVVAGRDFKGDAPDGVAFKPALVWDWSNHALGRAELMAKRAEKARKAKRRAAERRAKFDNGAVGRLFTHFYDLRAGHIDPSRLGTLTGPLVIFAVMLEVARLSIRVLAAPFAFIRWIGRRLARLRPARSLRFRAGVLRLRGREAAKRHLQGLRLVQLLLTQRSAASSARRFSRSLERALLSLRPDGSDMVLLATCDRADLDAVAAALARRPELRATGWHIVMREPLDVSGSSVFVLSEPARQLRNVLGELQRFAPGRLHLWADTAELARQYAQLGLGAVGELPVAVPDAIFAMADDARHAGPLVVGYLGDARQEKGFDRLPELVDAVSRRLRPDEVGYLVQTNFNVRGGVRATRSARLRLKSLDNLGVATLDTVQGQDAYYRNLAACDVLLMCYDSPLYIAGSSGVVAEAMAAGRPVVVHDATWSGRQVRESSAFRQHARQLIQARSRLELRDPLGLDLTIPKGVNVVAVEARFVRLAPGDPFAIVLDFGGQRRRILRRHVSSAQETAYVVVRVPLGTSFVRLELDRLDPTFVPEDLQVTLHFCAAPDDLALGAVGVGIEHWREAPDALEEIVRNYDHYRRTATDCSKARWREHGMAALADRLMSAATAG